MEQRHHEHRAVSRRELIRLLDVVYAISLALSSWIGTLVAHTHGSCEIPMGQRHLVCQYMWSGTVTWANSQLWASTSSRWVGCKCSSMNAKVGCELVPRVQDKRDIIRLRLLDWDMAA